MTIPVTQLPDCDSFEGMSISGQIVDIQYRNAVADAWYGISMTLPNAQFLLSLLSDLPDADQIFQRAREFRRQHPIR